MKRVLATVLVTALTACGAEEVRDPEAGLLEAPAPVTAGLEKPDKLPIPNGPCPDFKDDYVEFKPRGQQGSRWVRLFMSPAARTKNGPLIFYWYGTGSNPDEVHAGFGPDQLADLREQGGIIAAPVHVAGPYPWHYVNHDNDDDLLLADEVVACAIRTVGINTSRIHSVGFSAGGLQTTQMGYRRSNYIASVVTYSGGFQRAMPNRDPSNKFAALIYHGGQGDWGGSMSFEQASSKYHNDLKNADHFSLICNHGGNHSIPNNHGGLLRFLEDHPYGAKNSYPGGLPASLPDYCRR